MDSTFITDRRNLRKCVRDFAEFVFHLLHGVVRNSRIAEIFIGEFSQ